MMEAPSFAKGFTLCLQKSFGVSGTSWRDSKVRLGLEDVQSMKSQSVFEFQQ